MKTEAQRIKYNLAKKKARERRVAIILQATGNSKLAGRARDWSDKHIAEVVNAIEIENSLIVYTPSGLDEQRSSFIHVKIPKETTKQRYKRQYKEAKDLGYTVAEANKLRSAKEEEFNEMVKFNKVFNQKSRYDNWSRMASRASRELPVNFDQWIIDEASRINEDNGYDINASFGWNAVYHYYTEGGTIEFWENYFIADPLNANIYEARILS